MKIEIATSARFLADAIHANSVISSPFDSLRSLRVNSPQSRMEQFGKLRHRREGQRLSEREVSEPNLSILPVL